MMICLLIVYLFPNSFSFFFPIWAPMFSALEVLELSGNGSWRMVPAATYEFGQI